MTNGQHISLEAIEKAASRIRGYAHRTPLYSSFSEKNAWLKLECFQPVRSFKIRGASNKILCLSEAQREKGVITASSGNHGLAVSYVAGRLGIPATIVVPEDVVPEKLRMIKSLGSKVVLHGKQQDERQRKAEEIQRVEGQNFIPPFNDYEIIAGQGTCGLEIVEDLPELETVFVPIGGGGLISGIATAIKLGRIGKKARVIGVQPEGSAPMYKSLKSGSLQGIEESKTLADGLSVRFPGSITFEIVREFVDDIVLVSDEEILRATARLIKEEHILSEPSGAAAFAGLMKSEISGKSAAVVSGGNISSEMLSRVISQSRA